MAQNNSGIDLYRAASSIEKKKGNRTPRTDESQGSSPPESLDNKRKAAADSVSPQPTGFLKTTGTAAGGGRKENTPGSKAARLLLLLGTEEAAEVMTKLHPEEAEEVARQIAATPRVDAVEAKALLDEFGDRFSDMEVRRARGGVDAAREILTAAFGEDKASSIINTAVPEAVPGPFSFLDDLTFTQLANLLRKENPVTLSLVMAYLDPAQASRILESLPDEDRAAVVLRMARTEKVSREVIDTVENALQEKLRLIGKDDSEEMDGRAALADILRFMDLSDERRLLDGLEDADPDLADQVKEKLYTMDSVLHLRDKDLQKILFNMDEKSVAVILKGQTPEIRDRILSSLSSRRRILVADEGDMMGPLPRSEVDVAVREFLDRIREGEESGAFIIMREEEDLID